MKVVTAIEVTTSPRTVKPVQTICVLTWEGQNGRVGVQDGDDEMKANGVEYAPATPIAATYHRSYTSILTPADPT